MDNLVPLRRNQPYLVGEMVFLGTNTEPFKIANLGLCGPRETELGPAGYLENASEFVQLLVPGSDGRVFHAHVSYLRRA